MNTHMPVKILWLITAVVELIEKIQSARNDFSASDKPFFYLAIPNLRLLNGHLNIIASTSQTDCSRCCVRYRGVAKFLK